MTYVPADGRWPGWLALIKIVKIPFWFIWITPVIFGYYASSRTGGANHVVWLVLIVLGTCLLEAAGCVHNELRDRDEDLINQPKRAHLLAALNETWLRRFVIGSYAACATGLLVFAIRVDPVLAAVMCAGGLVTPLYNWGVRLKDRPALAQLGYGVAVLVTYLTGWGLNRPIVEAPPLVWVLALFLATSEYRGEPAILVTPAAAGTSHSPYVTAAFPAGFVAPTTQTADRSSVWRLLSRVRHFVPMSSYLSPYALLAGFVAAGWLPLRFLSLLVLIIPALTIARAGSRVVDTNSMIVVYEAGFVYVHLFFVGLFVLDTPTAAAATLGAVLCLARTVSVLLGLAPRFVEPAFSWKRSLGTILRDAT